MKHVMNSIICCKEKAISLTRTLHAGKFTLLSIILCCFLITGCMKERVSLPLEEVTIEEIQGTHSQGNTVNGYNGLHRQTEMQLQQARAASSRYRNIKNAIKDGYTDIHVNAPNMGHHYMNAELLNDGFDPRKPEILVYNKNEQGNFELVAVEYAIHLTDPMPEGFYGSNDVWDGASGFPFWLLHAWVWRYNPDGVFNPTNPDVHLHE